MTFICFDDFQNHSIKPKSPTQCVGLFFYTTTTMKTIFTNYLKTFGGLSQEVWWLALVTLINRAGTMVIPFLSLYLTDNLDYSLKDVGWVMSAFGLGSVLGSWLGGKLTDTVGYYKIMMTSLILSGLMFIGLQYITDFYAFCVGIFLLVIVADTFRPAMFVALSAYSKPENKTRSVTLIRLAINLGFSAGPAIGGLIIHDLGYDKLFWVDGVTCILAGFLLLQVLSPKKTTVISQQEKVEKPQSAYGDKTYLIFLFSTLLFAVVFLQYFSSIPLFYRDGHGLTEMEIGLLLGANGLIIFLFEMPLVKFLEDSKLSQVKLMVAGVVLIGLSFLVLNLSSWAGVLIIGMLFITVGEMIVFPFSNAFAMQRSERGNQGEYMALYSIAFSLAHIVGHNTGMQLIDWLEYTSTWYIFVGLSVLSILLLFRLKRTVEIESEA